MHAKAAQHGLRVLRFDENPPKLPLSQSRLKYHHGSYWCWVPGRPRILLRTKKSSFSPQDLHGFWGGGITVFPIQLLIPKIDNILALYRSNYTAVPGEYNLRSLDIDRFL